MASTYGVAMSNRRGYTPDILSIQVCEWSHLSKWQKNTLFLKMWTRVLISVRLVSCNPSGGSELDVGALLGHASIATTARYLARMEGESEQGWEGVAAALGVA